MMRSKPVRAAGWVVLGLGVAGACLWWVADHRRGVGWAIKVVASRFPDVPQLSSSELAAWLGDGTREAPMIVDARSEEEFATSHLAGARRVDPAASDEELRRLARTDAPIVVYCSAGYRASALARRMRANGYGNVSNLAGGIFHWANDGREVVCAGEPTTRVHPFHRAFSRLLHPSRRMP